MELSPGIIDSINREKKPQQTQLVRLIVFPVCFYYCHSKLDVKKILEAEAVV